MDALDFQLKQHQIYLKQRSVDRIIQSNLFRDIWDQANKKKRRKAIKYIYLLMVKKLQLWLYDDFENFSIRELRQVASHNHILNYTQYTKAELITILLKRNKDERN